ncbi:MAG: aminoacyl-tRNA hydrolase [bacterium]|nr:aminoacyl-tRNA hydrolase [bacterium]
MGLGNPGRIYRNTWHNAGFQVVDRLLAEYPFAAGSGLRLGRIHHEAVALLKPRSFMNSSGEPVRRSLGRLGLGPGDLLLVHDDLDLPLGRLRFRQAGGAGGHRGVASVIAALGTDRFSRLKLGIGRPSDNLEPRQFVLSPPPPAARPAREALVTMAARAVVAWIIEGPEAAMQAFHSREDQPCGQS